MTVCFKIFLQISIFPSVVVVVEVDFSVPLWSKLDFCTCTWKWTKLNNNPPNAENIEHYLCSLSRCPDCTILVDVSIN